MINKGEEPLKVPAASIKERRAQFQKDGVKVRATLELNAGATKPPTGGTKSSPTPGDGFTERKTSSEGGGHEDTEKMNELQP